MAVRLFRFLSILVSENHPDRRGVRALVRTHFQFRQIVDGVFRLKGYDGVVIALYDDRGNALRDDTYLLGRTYRQVDDSSLHIRAAVGNPDDHLFAVGGIGHLEHRAERIGAMGTGQTVVVKPFTAGRLPS